MVSSNIASNVSDDIEGKRDEITPTQGVIAAPVDEKKSKGSNDGELKLLSSEIGTVEEENSQYLSGQKRVLLSLSLSLVVFILGMVRLQLYS